MMFQEANEQNNKEARTKNGEKPKDPMPADPVRDHTSKEWAQSWSSVGSNHGSTKHMYVLAWQVWQRRRVPPELISAVAEQPVL